MHELSIARSVINSVEKICHDDHFGKVSETTLDIGTMSGVSKSALLFCWPLATKQTLLEECHLVINEIPLTLECLACNLKSSPEVFIMCCEHCGSGQVRIETGNELKIKNMEAY